MTTPQPASPPECAYVGHFSASLRSTRIVLHICSHCFHSSEAPSAFEKIADREPSLQEEAKGHNELRLHASSVRDYFRTTICTVPAPLQNQQRSPSISFPEPEHSRHLAVIWNSTLLVSGTLPGVSFTTSARSYLILCVFRGAESIWKCSGVPEMSIANPLEIGMNTG